MEDFKDWLVPVLMSIITALFAFGYAMVRSYIREKNKTAVEERAMVIEELSDLKVGQGKVRTENAVIIESQKNCEEGIDRTEKKLDHIGDQVNKNGNRITKLEVTISKNGNNKH